MSILITRPKNQAEYTAQVLKKKGYDVLIDSLIEIEVNTEITNSDLNQFSHFVVTSTNAVKYIYQLNLNKNKVFFAVGNKSKEEIKKLGFKSVIGAKNSAISLRDLMIKKLDKNKDKVLYFRGDVVSYDLGSFFQKQGFDFHSNIAYKSRESSGFKQETIVKIKANEISQILIYSQRAAEVFCRLSKFHGILNEIIDIEIVCLSNNISSYFSNEGFLRVNILPLS
jgi:uroporphyrinogen-III synthase